MFKDKKNLIVIAVIFVGATIFFLFRGSGTSLSFKLDAENRTISFSGPENYSYSIPFDDIKSLDLYEDIETGDPVNGTIGRKFTYGSFHNSAFGDYEMCCLTKLHTYVVFTETDGDVFVFNIENKTTTAEFYRALPEYLQSQESASAK